MISFAKIILFNLFCFAVFAQSASMSASMSSPSSMPSMTPLQLCAMKNSCSADSMSCQALCAGVPNPSAAQIGETNNCVANCNQTDTEAYKNCQTNCINKYYRHVDIPASDSVDSNGKRRNSSSASAGASNALSLASGTNLMISLAIGSLLMAFA